MSEESLECKECSKTFKDDNTYEKHLTKCKKQKLGQFFTTNYKYILQNLFIPNDIHNIIEPFTGNGDLLQFITNKDDIKIECYDISPIINETKQRDTLSNPPNYTNKFILTNPPYLARNKSKEKAIFDKYNVNDLYKCFIKELLTNKCNGGIIIIPLNFWSSIRMNDVKLRKDFLKVYSIVHLNIFEERVFSDTSYTVCSFQFILNNSNNKKEDFPISVYPCNKKININLNKKNNYTIGGEIYKLKGGYNITRLTRVNIKDKNTNIVIKCIDDNKNSKIGLSFIENDKDLYIDNTPNLSCRTYATLVIKPTISINIQRKLVSKFNNFLNENRDKYHSLFLTNYRESKDIARKRISFDLVYNIISYLLTTSEELKEYSELVFID